VAEKPVLAKVLRRFCGETLGGHLLNAGELCDSFIAPEYISFMASELREANEEYGRPHRLLLLTKSADPWPLLKINYQDVILHSVSVNTETNAKGLEEGAPSPNKEIHAAMRLKEASYEVRVRVDPIIAGSEPAYTGLMERICAFIEPGLITLGSLRATPRTWRFLPATVREQPSERTPWERGYSLETRITLHNELITVAKDHGIPVALCKESPEVWRSLQLKGPCNCMP
jgi:DNA repair photolyase